MNSLQKLHELQQATLVLSEIPLIKLKENEKLLTEIKRIVSGDNVASIVNAIGNEQRLEKYDYQFDPLNNGSPESTEFTKKFVAYKNSCFDVFAKNKETERFYTKLPIALNQTKHVSKKSIAECSNAVTKSGEAKDFQDVYNSIFSNRALEIGTQRDPTFIQSYIDYSPYLYNYQAYLAIPTLSQTVDRPIEIATKKKPIIDFKDDNLDRYFDKYLKINKILPKLRKFLLYSTLSPRGSLIAPILTKSGHVEFGVYNDTQFTYSVASTYAMFNNVDNDYGISAVYLLGKVLQPGTTCHFYCPGFEPLFGIGKNKMIPLKGAAEAINIYLYTIKVLCIRAQVMVQKWSGGGATDSLLDSMKKMSDQINSRLSLNTSVKLVEGAELTLLNNNLSEGFAKISPIIKEFQAVLTGVAPDRLYGSDTAYSANNFNVQMTNENIRSEIQEPCLEPALMYMVNTCLQFDKDLKQFSHLENEFEVVFESIYEPTGNEKITEDKGKIDNLISMSGYPELQEIFKKEKLFPKDSELPAPKETDPAVPQT